MQSFAPPSARFSSVHVDIVDPSPVSDGYSYILTVIDRFTRWPEAIPMQNITAKPWTDAFLLNWVARFGAPSEIITDRGRQFVSTLWKETCEFLGSQHMTTTAYHPQANGLNERFKKSLKVALKAQVDPMRWHTNLA